MKVSDCVDKYCPWLWKAEHGGYTGQKGLSKCMKLLIPVKDVKDCPVEGRDMIEVRNEHREYMESLYKFD